MLCSTIAAAVRTSWSTVAAAPRWDKELRDAVDSPSSLAPSISNFSGMLAPEFWDNIAIARFLVKAAIGDIGPKKFGTKVVVAILKAKAELQRQRSEFPRSPVNTQKIIYKSLAAEL